MWKSRKSSTADKPGFNDDARCVWCSSVLIINQYFLRVAGTPPSYQKVYICDNNRCVRYGLASIYKLKGTGTEND